MKAKGRRGHPILKALTPRNLLSFGPDTVPFELGALNVLIGPNGSGKSNLLEAIALLRACLDREGFWPALAKGGGIGEWVWKGRPLESASVEALVSTGDHESLSHLIALRADQQTVRLDRELISNEVISDTNASIGLRYGYQNGRSLILDSSNRKRKPIRDFFNPDVSVLSQRQDPESFPEIACLTHYYGRIRLYREWSFGRKSIFREPQKADMRNDRLEEDFSNLGLFLNRLRRSPKAKSDLLDNLADLYQGLTDFDVIVEGGTVQVYLTEGEYNIPATRLSDGTLRYLCLLAILCDPDPPPLIGIEEPEIGLHPDILPKVAKLLIEASQRTQLIVTTHSENLVDALTDHPGSIVICEKKDGQTTLSRPDPKALAEWLRTYSLGRLWMSGQLGGTRW